MELIELKTISTRRSTEINYSRESKKRGGKSRPVVSQAMNRLQRVDGIGLSQFFKSQYSTQNLTSEHFIGLDLRRTDRRQSDRADQTKKHPTKRRSDRSQIRPKVDPTETRSDRSLHPTETDPTENTSDQKHIRPKSISDRN